MHWIVFVILAMACLTPLSAQEGALAKRLANERGHTELAWLDSYHSFSFGTYVDPEQIGFGTLRVLNDDRLAPDGGFSPHHHQDMEIISYVIDGALQHKDNLGNGSVILGGNVQRMSAGSGVEHSEYNASKEKPVHFLQIWIEPNQHDLSPSYEQKHFSRREKSGRLRLIASPDGRDQSLTIHQDVVIFAGLFDGEQVATYRLDPNRKAWIQVVRGSITVNHDQLHAGDGAAIAQAEALHFGNGEGAEILLFDLAK